MVLVVVDDFEFEFDFEYSEFGLAHINVATMIVLSFRVVLCPMLPYFFVSDSSRILSRLSTFKYIWCSSLDSSHHPVSF